uniref:U3 small nucleolar RNA-associated protein 4 homolog n=1 Tax=Hirondellea gigas TaxID=1518452 RepID=A0A2P2I7N2_9CRUS
MTARDKIIHNIQFLDHTASAIQRLAYDDTTDKLALVRSDNSIELWNCTHRIFRQKVIKRANKGSIECLVFCKSRLFSGSLDGKVIEHPLKHCSNVQQKSSVVVTGGACWCLAASYDQTFIAAGSEKGYVLLYTLTDDGLQYSKVLEQLSGRVIAVSWLKSGSHLVAATVAHLHICSIERGMVNSIRLGRSLELGKSAKKDMTRLMLWSLLVLPDFTIVAGDSRGMVTFWCGKTQTQISSVTSHKGAVLSLTHSSDCNSVYAAGADPTIRHLIRHGEKWFNSHKIEGHTHDVRSLVMDRHDRLLSGSADSRLGVFSFPPKVVYHISQAPTVGSVSISGENVLHGSGHHLQWWRLGGHGHKHSSKQDVLPSTQGRVLVARIVCHEEDSVVCCALNPSANIAGYATLRRNLKLYRLNKPSGCTELSLTSISVGAIARSSSESSSAEDLQIRRLLWLTDHSLVAITMNNQIQVWGISQEKASLSFVLPSIGTATTADILLSNNTTDEDLLYLSASQCGQLLVAATATVCVVYQINTGKHTVMPSHTSLITAVCVRSRHGSNMSNGGGSTSSKRCHQSPSSVAAVSGTVVVAYADLILREYDVLDASITPFGERIANAIAQNQNRLVVQNMSWDEHGDVLSLHDDTRIVFFSKKSVLGYSWDVVPKKKFKLVEDDNLLNNKNLMLLYGGANGAVQQQLTNGDSNNSSIELYVNKKRRVRHFNTKIDPVAEVWSKLSGVVSRTNSTIVLAQQLAGDAVASVELSFDAVRASLPLPLDIAKFGSK